MRRPSLTCVCLVPLLSSGQAIADLSPRSDQCSVRISRDSAAVSSAFSGYVSASDIRFCFWGSLGQCGLPGASDGRCLIKRADPPGPSVQNTGLGESIAAHEAGAVLTWEVPPPPGSASLALTGLLGVASVQVLRSARNWNFSSAPEWYYGAWGSPIGDAASVFFDVPLGDGALANKPSIQRDHGWGVLSHLESLHLPPAVSPRGPPS